MREAQKPLEYAEIAERILTQGYYETDGATPRATVNAQITSSIRRGGEASPFVKIARGVFGLREMANAESAAIQPPVIVSSEAFVAVTEAEVENSDSIIRSFGMYWQRDLVIAVIQRYLASSRQWQPLLILAGRKVSTSSMTIILLCMSRSIDRPLGRRLYEHTIDRLGSRWNRFSWFGLLDVTPEGGLRELPLVPSLVSMIGTLEALLIESLEPPQNRKRGDDFSAVEHIQDIDPEIHEREIQNTLRSIEQNMRGNS